jgi:hypothetical protein
MFLLGVRIAKMPYNAQTYICKLVKREEELKGAGV